MAKFDAIFFDLDGTLIDSKEDICSAVNHTLKHFDYPQLGLDEVNSYVGYGVRRLLQDVLGLGHDQDLEGFRKVFLDYYSKNLLVQSEAYLGVNELLLQLHPMPMAIVTNKLLFLTEKIVDGLAWGQYFQWIVGGDSYPKMKPDPIVFSQILENIEFPNEKIIMVGDSPSDIEVAQAAGIRSCAVSYGFRSHEELEASRPDYLVSDVKGLKQVLC